MKEKEVALYAVGDVMMGGEFPEYMTNNCVDYQHIFGNIEELFANSNIVFCNLECSLFKSGPKRSENWIVYSPPESILALKRIKCDIVSLGNNHIMDYGEKGLIDSKEFLEINDIKTIGAGKNVEEASTGVIIEKEGIKLGFISYLSDEYPNSTIATENSPGCVSYKDYNKIKQDIDHIKEKADIVCVSIHWGKEFFEYPSTEQIKIAHQIIDFGCNIIIGHHPHVVQGVEEYNNGIIAYSLGNFFFPDLDLGPSVIRKWSEESKHSFILECTFSDRKIKNFKIIPCTVNNEFQLIENKEQKYYEKLNKLSTDLKCKNYSEFYKSYESKKNNEIKILEKKMGLEILSIQMKELGFLGCLGKINRATFFYFLRTIFSYSAQKFENITKK